MNPKHHPIGPSRARWAELCPAGPALEKRAIAGKLLLTMYPDASEEGEEGHEEIARQNPLASALSREAHEFLAWVAPSENRLSEHFEHEVTLGTPEVLTHGTPDYFAIYRSHAVLVDFKLGHAEPDHATVALQTDLYAAAIMEGNENLLFVRVHLWRPGAASRAWIVDREQVHEIIGRYRDILTRAQDPLAAPRPGYVQCRYCSAKAVCPAWESAINAHAEVDPGNRAGLHTIHPERLAQALELALLVEPWAKALKARIKETVAKYPWAMPPGWELATRAQTSVRYKNVVESIKTTHPELGKEIAHAVNQETTRSSATYFKRSSETKTQKEVTSS